MNVVHDGSGAAPPLLLIHGSGASGATWSPIVPALAARYHVIRVDLPGCGQSPPAGSYEVPAQVDRVAGLLDGLGLRRVAVAGHSSGGYIATALAERHPDLVGSLTLISTGPSLGAFRPEPVALRVVTGPVLGPLVWRIRTDGMIRGALAAVTARPVTIPDGFVADMRALPYRRFREVLRCYEAYLRERTVPDRLADVDVPVLVVFGAADPRWDPAAAQDYARVPGVRLEMLPGVGHLPMVEAPEQTAGLLLSAGRGIG